MSELSDVVQKMIAERGPLTFREFMDTALYHPRFGYYTCLRKVGMEGDFYTAADVTGLYGRQLAKEMTRLAGEIKSKKLNIVEFGAGSGRLAADILTYYRRRLPRRVVDYIIIEKSPSLAEVQQTNLATWSGMVRWCSHSEIERRSLTGFILQNEVIDAFAVHRVVMTTAGLREIYVTYEDGGFKEITGPPSTPQLAAYLKANQVALRLEQQAEINLAAPAWLAAISKILRRGFIFTIDYGGTAAEIYSLSRVGGTLNCYYRHRLVDNPYSRLGRQDITAHVNFTALIERGEQLGLKTRLYKSQAQFLIDAGILTDLAAIETESGRTAAYKAGLAVKKLIMPGGMGERFRVLIQEKS